MKTELSKRAGNPMVGIQQVVYYSDVTPAADGKYITATKDVKSNLVALDNAIKNIPAQVDYTVTCTESTPAGYAKTYTLTQNGSTVATINIPKDMVVSSGRVVTNPEGQDPGTYIELTLANATSDKIYINVGTLVDIYTTGSQAGDMVVVDVDNQTHHITATLTDGTVTKAKLDSGVQASLDKADSAVQSVALASGTNNGTVKLTVDGVDTDNIAVTGLKSAAYQETSAFQPAGNYKRTQIAVEDKAVAGKYVSQVTQTANGEITVTRADLPTAPTVDQIYAATSTNAQSGTAVAQAVSGAVEALDAEVTSSDGTNVQVKVTEVDGKITAVNVTDTTASSIHTHGNISNDGKVGTASGKVLVTGEGGAVAAGELDGTYNATTNKIATKSTVTDAIAALDVTEVSVGASKTVDKISETDGKISVTTTDIQIAESQVTDLTTHLNAKADKVTGATADHIATFVTGGGIQDSGKVVEDFATAAQGTLAESALQPSEITAGTANGTIKVDGTDVSVTGVKTVQTAVSDPTASGNAIAFIDTISQNTNGEVSVTKKTVDTDGSTITVANSKLKVADGGISTTQLANGAVETSKLAVLTSFQIMDAATTGDYVGQVYTITIDHGVLTITPAGRA